MALWLLHYVRCDILRVQPIHNRTWRFIIHYMECRFDSSVAEFWVHFLEHP